MYHTLIHVSAGVVRVVRPRPDDPNRASGEGRDGSDPPLSTAGAVRRGVGCPTRCTTGCTTPPRRRGGRSRPMYPCRKAPRPARGPDDEQRRAARWVTDSSARFSSSAASVPRAPGRGRARSPRPIPWRCSSAIARRTFTPPSSRGTTSRPAWPRCWPGNFSSAHHGSGSPGWACVWGSGPAFHAGRFRPRRTARPSSSARCITRSESPRARPRNG